MMTVREHDDAYLSGMHAIPRVETALNRQTGFLIMKDLHDQGLMSDADYKDCALFILEKVGYKPVADALRSEKKEEE